jgi:hypothetical protein
MQDSAEDARGEGTLRRRPVIFNTVPSIRSVAKDLLSTYRFYRTDNPVDVNRRELEKRRFLRERVARGGR